MVAFFCSGLWPRAGARQTTASRAARQQRVIRRSSGKGPRADTALLVAEFARIPDELPGILANSATRSAVESLYAARPVAGKKVGLDTGTALWHRPSFSHPYRTPAPVGPAIRRDGGPATDPGGSHARTRGLGVAVGPVRGLGHGRRR